MGWLRSRHTVVTNIVQQTSSVLIFLTVPNLLPVESYGQVTFVATLLAFITFADFGMSFVYSRKMPGIHASGNDLEAQRWNETVFSFRLGTSLLFGAVIGAIYYFKYHSFINAILLLFVPLLSVIASFSIAQNTAQSNFTIYRKINSFQAIARLLTIAGVMFLSVLGWFLAQLAAGLLTVIKVLSKGGLPNPLRVDWGLLRAHFLEALMLGAITTLWIQLLASGKVFASFLYSDAVIGQYGLMNAGYQIVASLIIAAFIPQTVEIYKMAEVKTPETLEYIFKVIIRTIPLVFFLAVLSRETAPLAIAYFFPAYHVDSIMLDGLIFSITTYPIIVTLGSILIAKGKGFPYLLLLAMSLLINFLLIEFLDSSYGIRAAAIAQLAALYLYAVLLLLLSVFLFRKEIKNRTLVFVKISSSYIGLFSIYFFCKSLMTN